MRRASSMLPRLTGAGRGYHLGASMYLGAPWPSNEVLSTIVTDRDVKVEQAQKWAWNGVEGNYPPTAVLKKAVHDYNKAHNAAVDLVQDISVDIVQENEIYTESVVRKRRQKMKKHKLKKRRKKYRMVTKKHKKQ